MRKILLILILFNGGMALAQQESMYTHYMYNVMAVNPAYAGAEGLITTTLLHRSQWGLFPGAPRHQTFSVESSLGRNVGAGLSFVNDQVGPERNIAIKTYYSYTIRSNERLKISFGLKAGLNMLQIGLADLELATPDDPAFMNNIESAIMPSFGVGILMYTEDYYFGVSAPDLVQHDYLNNKVYYSSNLSLESKKYYVIGGASYPLSDLIIFKPSTSISIGKDQTELNNLALEVNLGSLFVIDNMFAGGIMYRSHYNAVAFLAGVMITPEIEIGYSFDMLITNSTDIYNGGNHEIVLKYRFNNSQNRNRGGVRKRSKGQMSCPTFQ
jgi:type IX secretion system PorP/SprF family membrane protein